MPRPRRPRTAFPTAAAVAAQGLTVDQVDPDHLTFLEHVRPDGNSYAVELPARGGAPPVTVKYEAGTPAAASGKAPIAPVLSPAPAGSGRVVDREGNPLWYETAENMDEDYRKFWRQTYMENGRLVLQVEDDKIVRYDLDAVPVRISDIADGAKKKGGEEVGGGGGVGAVEKEITAPIKADRTALEHRVGDSLVISQKKACVAPAQKAEQGQEENGKNEGKGGAEKIKVVKRKGEMLNELPVKTLNAVNRETNSSNGHAVGPHPASGFHGVVWPIHIMERPASSFKEKLLRDLRRPFSMVEYKELLHEATLHRQATKGRQTRRGVTYYKSTHEVNQSYFDIHPDLAEQVRSTSYPNQLALLRGFVFWLKNVTNDDQFRPWRDDFRQYKIVPYE